MPATPYDADSQDFMFLVVHATIAAGVQLTAGANDQLPQRFLPLIATLAAYAVVATNMEDDRHLLCIFQLVSCLRRSQSLLFLASDARCAAGVPFAAYVDGRSHTSWPFPRLHTDTQASVFLEMYSVLAMDARFAAHADERTNMENKAKQAADNEDAWLLA